jgi:hypothetical protein
MEWTAGLIHGDGRRQGRCRALPVPHLDTATPFEAASISRRYFSNGVGYHRARLVNACD